jgi:hypothetical protein
MRYRTRLWVSILVLAGLNGAFAASGQHVIPLCELQQQVAAGNHKIVEVGGVFLAGLEGEYLVASGCSERSTRIEFALIDKKNVAKLWHLVDAASKPGVKGDGVPVRVVFEGEFYGPPLLDPKMSEVQRRLSDLRWDSNSTTKLVVHSIKSVEALSPSDPCAPQGTDPADKWPCWQHPSSPNKTSGVPPTASLSHKSGHADQPKQP